MEESENWDDFEEEKEFYFQNEIFNRDLWSYEKRNPSRTEFLNKIEEISFEEENKVNKWKQDECIAEHIAFQTCYYEKFSFSNLCFSDAKKFWGCLSEKKVGDFRSSFTLS